MQISRVRWGIVINYAQGMSVETKTIVKQPDKIRTEAEMNGQTTILIINGDKGWVSAPGQPIMPMPEQLMVMTKGQPKDVASGYRWNPSDNTFKMGEEVEHDGKILQGVKIIPNKVMPMISNMVVYFDKQTGLPVYSTVDIAANGQTMAARVDYSDYKTFGKIATIPSVCKTTIVNGAEIMKLETKELEYNYLTTDDMFAEPK